MIIASVVPFILLFAVTVILYRNWSRFSPYYLPRPATVKEERQYKMFGMLATVAAFVTPFPIVYAYKGEIAANIFWFIASSVGMVAARAVPEIRLSPRSRTAFLVLVFFTGFVIWFFIVTDPTTLKNIFNGIKSKSNG